MKFKQPHFLLFLSSILLLTACSPHPGTGVWKTDSDNPLGIEKLVGDLKVEQNLPAQNRKRLIGIVFGEAQKKKNYF